METPNNKFDDGKWELWFAWYPVHLHGGVKFAWLRRISRRFVLAGPKHMRTEYTDTPSDFPPGYGLRTAKAPPKMAGPV
jgi:hypothetical protein